MSHEVRKVLAVAAFLTIYGALRFLYDTNRITLWAEQFARNPKARWARDYRRDALIASEFHVAPSEVSINA